MFISRVEYSDDAHDMAAMDADYQPAPRSNAETVLDDVFGASGSEPSDGFEPRGQPAMPSDMPRLEREHATAGYRDGITAAKALSVQAGFDEGFSLGASIGSKVGQVLGLLDGIAESVSGGTLPGGSCGVNETAADPEGKGQVEPLLGEGSDDKNASDDDDKLRITRLSRTAREALKVEAVFGADYWFPDGTWKFDVVRGASDATEPEDIVFEDVANAHPLIREWTAVAEEEARRWGVNMDVLAVSTETADAVEETREKEQVPLAAKPVAESKNSRLDW